MRFSFISEGLAWQQFVSRLFVADRDRSDSSVRGFKTVSAERLRDYGLDGIEADPTGTIYQMYLPLWESGEPRHQRVNSKLNDTCRKLIANATEIESIIGSPVKNLILIIPEDPDVKMREHERKLQGSTTFKIDIWGETEISGLLSRHQETVRDFLPFSIETLSAQPQLPAGLNRYKSVVDEMTVVLPTRSLSFNTAHLANYLFPRSQLHEVISDLTEFGHALVVGPPGTGKSILGLQVATSLLKDDPLTTLSSIDAYYCTAPQLSVTETLRFLNTDKPTLLIIDDAHEDEDNACGLFDEWAVRRNLNQHQKLYLLFLSQSYYTEDDENRINNLFHRHHRIVRSLPDDNEISQITGHLWKITYGDDIPEIAIRSINRKTGNTPALASLAVRIASYLPKDDSADESSFRSALLDTVRQHYRIEDYSEAAARACIFAYYNIPINIKAFGEDSAAPLMATGFLVKSLASNQEVTLFSRSIGELWYESKYFDNSELTDTFISYLEQEDSNYHQVLVGIRRNGNISLLIDVINNNYPTLQARLNSETDIHKAALALDCISACLRGVARKLIEQCIEVRSLADRIQGCRDVSALSRYLHIITYYSRRIFISSKQNILDDAKRSLNILQQTVQRREIPLPLIAHLCESVARSDKEAARQLVGAAIKSRGITLPKGGQANNLTKDFLIFAGVISWFDRDTAHSFKLDAKRLTTLLLQENRPDEIAVLIESLASLDQRTTVRALRNVITSGDFAKLANNLIQPPTNLYSLGQFIKSVRQVSRKLGSQLALKLIPNLEEAVDADRRLSAISSLLSVVRETNSNAARLLLSSLNKDSLRKVLASESSPIRFGRTITTVARIDAVLAGDHVESLSIRWWNDLFGRARNLTAVAMLLRGATLAAYNPDKVIDKLLRENNIVAKIDQLARDNKAVGDLSNYASIVSATYPISHDSKKQLLSFLRPNNFEDAIKKEYDPRRVGQAFRAYSAAFPSEAYDFTVRIIKDHDRDTQNAGKSSYIKHWIMSDDISSVAFLLFSACEINGQLSDTLGSLISEGKSVSLLQQESRGTRSAEYLHALSLVSPLKARNLTSRFYRLKSPVELIQDAENLRELVEILTSIRASNNKFYKEWLFGTSPEAHNTHNRIKYEIIARCTEESNLGVLSILLSAIRPFDKQMAQEVIQSLDHEWIKQVGATDNQVTQVLQFITSVARTCVDQPPDAPSKRLLNQMEHYLYSETIKRLAEVRSVRGLISCLVEIFRTADSLKSAEVEELGWNSIRMEVISRTLDHTNDIVGCGLISFLLTRLSQIPSASEIARKAKTTVLNRASEQYPVNALIALALAGANQNQVENVVEKLDGLEAGKIWAVGFANWLAGQRAYLDGPSESPYPILTSELIQKTSWGASTDLAGVFRNEYKQAGGNLRFAFALAFNCQMGLNNSDDLAEINHDLYLSAKERKRFEAKYWVRDLLEEFSDGLDSIKLTLEKMSIINVAQCVRDLSPRVETLYLMGDDKEPLTSSEQNSLFI